MKKILLVSHKILDMRNFIFQLKMKYEVSDVAYLNTALYNLKKSEKYGLIIIEIAMPPQNLYTLKETADGARTGLVFYERIIKPLGIPTIFWSRSDDYSQKISQMDNNVIFVKRENEVEHLLEAVKKFISERGIELKKGIIK